MAKYLSFTGGKGGTGKSTVAINVAALLAREMNTVLVDMDVECPNDYILLSSGELENKEDVSIFHPVFDNKKCTKCGLCREACAENAIVQFKNGFPFLLPQICSGCRTCQIVCPEDAINDAQKLIGATYLNMVSINGTSFKLVTGVLKEGEERSFPVAKATKERALMQDAELYIFDTAAGTSNTVAESLLPVKMLFAVAEPTPLGIHDLRMILDLGEKIEIERKYLVINKADLGGEEEYNDIESMAASSGAEIIARIPYRKDMIESYIHGIPYVSTPDADQKVLEEFNRIVEVIRG